MSKLKGIPFEAVIIKWYRRRENSLEEALIEMCLARVSVHRVEDITEALWGRKVFPATISELNKNAYSTLRAGKASSCKEDTIRMPMWTESTCDAAGAKSTKM